MRIIIILSAFLAMKSFSQTAKSFEFPSKFSVKSLSKNDCTKFKTKGNFSQAFTWIDCTGSNYIIFTQTGKFQIKNDYGELSYDAEIYVYHYCIKGNDTILIRRIYDSVKDCRFDLYIGFFGDSISITDFDNNNIAEITFVYRYSCRSDFSPSYMKVIMLENGNKFILRGLMLVISDDKNEMEEMKTKYKWGCYTVDSSFNNAPKVFLEYAELLWDKYKYKDDFTQF